MKFKMPFRRWKDKSQVTSANLSFPREPPGYVEDGDLHASQEAAPLGPELSNAVPQTQILEVERLSKIEHRTDPSGRIPSVSSVSRVPTVYGEIPVITLRAPPSEDVRNFNADSNSLLRQDVAVLPSHNRRHSDVSILVAKKVVKAPMPKPLDVPRSGDASDRDEDTISNDNERRGPTVDAPGLLAGLTGSDVSNTSGVEDFWLEPFPLKVIMHVFISLDDLKVHEIEMDAAWYNPEVYTELLTTTYRLLDKFMEGMSVLDYKLYYRHGTFRIRNHRRTTPHITLDQEMDFQEKAVRHGSNFIHDHTYERFWMEVHWDFSFLRTTPKSDEDYSEMLRREIYRKSHRNFEDEQYVSRADLCWLAPEVVRHSANQDRKLSQRWTQKARDDFAERVIRVGAWRLFLGCTLAGISLLYLSHLMDCPEHYCDANLPPLEHNCEDEECIWQLGELHRTLPRLFACTFNKEIRFTSLKHDDVLPIQYVEGDHVIGYGAAGVVHCVKIDPAHHQFSGDRKAKFALKVFHERPWTTVQFEREHQMLQELAKFPHPHIVPHLASWGRRGRSYILYPLAKCNLRVFMQGSRRPRMTNSVVIWFLYQLRGLADALRNIHFLGGPLRNPEESSPLQSELEARTAFHHDIKPENILVFEEETEQGPILKISDFGAAKISRQLSRGTSERTSKPEGTTIYDGPDLDMQIDPSRPWDLWAIGCVFLEFLSWLMLPYQVAVEEFASERMDVGSADLDNDRFWHRTEKCWTLRPAVIRRLRELERYHCQGLRGLLDVIQVIRKCLTIDPQKRITSETLLHGLDAILKQAESDCKAAPGLYMPSTNEFQGQPSLQIEFPLDSSINNGRRMSTKNSKDLYRHTKGLSRTGTKDRETYSHVEVNKVPLPEFPSQINDKDLIESPKGQIEDVENHKISAETTTAPQDRVKELYKVVLRKTEKDLDQHANQAYPIFTSNDLRQRMSGGRRSYSLRSRTKRRFSNPYSDRNHAPEELTFAPVRSQIEIEPVQFPDNNPFTRTRKTSGDVPLEVQSSTSPNSMLRTIPSERSIPGAGGSDTQWVQVNASFRLDETRMEHQEVMDSGHLSDLPQIKKILDDPETHDAQLEALEVMIFENLNNVGAFETDYLVTDLVFSWRSLPEATKSLDLVTNSIRRWAATLDCVCTGVNLLHVPTSEPLSFSIIVKDRSRSNVCTVTPISLASLLQIQHFVSDLETTLGKSFDINGGTSSRNRVGGNHVDANIIEEGLDCLRDMCADMLLYLGLADDESVRGAAFEPKACVSTVEALLRILAIGLTSYVSSHIGSLSSTIATKAKQIITVYGKPVVYRQHRLACLSSFIGRPVWAFGAADNDDATEEARYAVSTLLADFDDLWGPSRITYTGNDLEEANEIKTFGGCLRSVQPASTDQFLPILDEILCHWSAWQTTPPPLIPFDPSKTLLIGADKSHFFTNRSCNNAQGHFFKGLYEMPIGTRGKGREVSAWQTGINLTAKVVGFSFSRQTKPVPSINTKNVIIDSWLELPINLDFHVPLIDALDEVVGLEISKCTGNAKRVTLWSIMRNAQLISHLEQRYKCIGLFSYWAQFDSFTSMWEDAEAHGWTYNARFMTHYVIARLAKTGVNEKGELSGWDIATEYVRVCTPSWAKMLFEWGHCSTFVIYTEECFEYVNGRRCLYSCLTESDLRLQNSKAPVMMTRIQVEALDVRVVTPPIFKPINGKIDQDQGQYHRENNSVVLNGNDAFLSARAQQEALPRIHRGGRGHKQQNAQSPVSQHLNRARISRMSAFEDRLIERRRRSAIVPVLDRPDSTEFIAPNQKSHGGQLVGRGSGGSISELNVRSTHDKAGSIPRGLPSLMQLYIVEGFWTLPCGRGHLVLHPEWHNRGVQFGLSYEETPIQMFWKRATPADVMLASIEQRCKKWDERLQAQLNIPTATRFRFSEARRLEPERLKPGETFKWVCVLDNSGK